MTDPTRDTDDGVAPPETDEMFDPTVERAVEKANQYHKMMDDAKEWSRKTASGIRAKAATEDDPTAEELESIAMLIDTVNARVEKGDNSLARQP